MPQVKHVVNIESFRRELEALCLRHGAFLKEEKIRREKPDSPIVFLEINISVKLDNENGWVIRSE